MSPIVISGLPPVRFINAVSFTSSKGDNSVSSPDSRIASSNETRGAKEARQCSSIALAKCPDLKLPQIRQQRGTLLRKDLAIEVHTVR